MRELARRAGTSYTTVSRMEADPPKHVALRRLRGAGMAVRFTRAAGSACEAIAAGLNVDGVPTATAQRGERRGLVAGPGGWHAATVARLCRNPHIRRAALAAA